MQPQPPDAPPSPAAAAAASVPARVAFSLAMMRAVEWWPAGMKHSDVMSPAPISSAKARRMVSMDDGLIELQQVALPGEEAGAVLGGDGHEGQARGDEGRIDG